jgi:hypothetical protein
MNVSLQIPLIQKFAVNLVLFDCFRFGSSAVAEPSPDQITQAMFRLGVDEFLSQRMK